MGEQLVNNYQTTLNGAIDDNDTTLVVTSATGAPPSGNFRLLVQLPDASNAEIMLVTNVSGTTFTVIRAYEPTAGVQTAVAHANGEVVAHVLTAGALQALGPAEKVTAYSLWR